MGDNVTNNDYTRCSECSTVYSNNQPVCPKCGKQRTTVNINTSFVSESIAEPVFNLLD